MHLVPSQSVLGPFPLTYYDPRISAREWSQRLLDGPLVVFDTETTGLKDDSELIEIACIDKDGSVLMDTLVKPKNPIPSAATAIHGLGDADVSGASDIMLVLPEIANLWHGKNVTSYNLQFDYRVLCQSLEIAGFNWYPPLADTTACIMEMYASYYGVWNRTYGEYDFQSLDKALVQCNLEREGGAHRALPDAKAALALLRYMAEH